MITTDKIEAVESNFVRRRLPWLIGAGGLLVYLATLNHWISLFSLGTVARTAGWLWQPEVERPLTLAVLFPFRILPDAWLPLALNLFTAVIAGLVLVQLARSVAILRHDVLPEGGIRKSARIAILTIPTAWMPPVLAAFVCGLQLTFWEHATSASGEMISLLCFAYAFRCLLEFRINQDQSWLSRGACVYAAGMADNWMMVGYFPAFVAAIIWVMGYRSFLAWRFLWRMTLWGMLGLSLYLLLPTLLSLSAHDPGEFWAVLKAQLRSQKQAVAVLRSPPFRLLALTGLLPFLILAIRWKSHTVQVTDDIPFGVFLNKATGHFVHTLFFVASLWIVLNPVFTPNNLDVGAPLLAYYYLWAVVAGYGAGYFLLFGVQRRPKKLPVLAMQALLGVLPVLLLWKNLGEIRMTNGPAVREFARELYEDLPAGKSVVLSDEPRQLLLLHAELASHSQDKDPILVDTPSLVSLRYHQFMASRYGPRWPDLSPTNRMESIRATSFLALVSGLASHDPLVYLHPSSGFFLEAFRDEPNGSVHRLVARRTGEESPLVDGLVVTNEAIWQRRWTEKLSQRARQFAANRRQTARWSNSPWKWLRLTRRPNTTVTALSVAYSKSINYWGVQSLRANRRPEAVEWFRRAIEINPDNLSAHLNLEYAIRCQRGDCARLNLAATRQQFPELFGKYDNWWEVLGRDGPVDEPTYLLLTGRVLLASGNLRQATSAFTRCAEMSPDWLAPKLWLAQSHNLMRNFAGALELTDPIQTPDQRLKGPGMARLLQARVLALRGLGRTNEAAIYLEQFVRGQGTHSEVLAAAASLYTQSGEFQSELELRGTLLSRDPNNPELLAKKGQAELRLGRFEPAIATLTQALTLAPGEHDARLLRAVACLGAGQLDAARADYRELLKQPGRSQSALFGLGGIAWRENDTNAVIEYYQQFLSNSAAGSPRHGIAIDRLKQVTEE